MAVTVTSTVLLGSRLPTGHVTRWDVTVHPRDALVAVSSGGSRSVMTIPVARDGPLLVTPIVKVTS